MRAPAAIVVAIALLGAPLLGSCGELASSDPGLGAMLRVEGGQFRPGPFPDDAGGPVASAVTTRHAHVVLGRFDEPLRGVLAPGARGAVIGLAGVPGTWLVTAGSPELDTPGQPAARAVFGISPELGPGPFTLQLAASDADGRFGPAITTELVADAEVPPDGELVIGLTWSGTADLDLHVTDPLGGEAWSDDPNTWQPPPPGEPVDPLAYLTGGILDHDGNRNCHRDAAPSEHVIWTMPPPPGGYVVKVDARAMCGAASAAWTVAAYRGGVLVGTATGLATAEDAVAPHGAGAGVLALRFAL